MGEHATVVVDPSNAEQARAWDGGEGEFWAAEAERFERSTERYDRHLFAAADLATDAAVLDVGCGTGATTRQAARLAPSGSALGVDLSSRMIAVARARAEQAGLTNAHFAQADAQVHPFPGGSFDAVLSRTGAMFFGDPEAAYANLARVLRPGGRLALVVWQPFSANEWIREIVTALASGRSFPPPPPGAPGPFSLSDPDATRSLLTRTGFVVEAIDGVHERMWFGHDGEDASRFILGVSGWMLDGLDDAGRSRALQALRASTGAHRTEDGVLFDSAAWIVRAHRD